MRKEWGKEGCVRWRKGPRKRRGKERKLEEELSEKGSREERARKTEKGSEKGIFFWKGKLRKMKTWK